METTQIKKPKSCPHEKTYVAIRHESGLTLVRCKACGAKV
jgi:hypothetical protein